LIALSCEAVLPMSAPGTVAAMKPEWPVLGSRAVMPYDLEIPTTKQYQISCTQLAVVKTDKTSHKKSVALCFEQLCVTVGHKQKNSR